MKNQERTFKAVALLICVFTFQMSFSQIKTWVNVGSGMVFSNGQVGIGCYSDLNFPINPWIACGLSMGYAGVSDKVLDINHAGSFYQGSIYSGDLNLALTPNLSKQLKFSLFGGCGIRHINSTDILVNGNFELTPVVINTNGFGAKTGLTVDYLIQKHYLVGLKYFHDFYREGLDYFGLNLGLILE
jgi:hypothetical protein